MFSFLRFSKKPSAPFNVDDDDDADFEYEEEELDEEDECEEDEPVETVSGEDRFGLADAARVFLLTIATASVVGGSMWAIKADAWTRLEESIAQRHGQRIDTAQIVFADPVVMVEGVEETLLAKAYDAARRDPLDRSSLDAIRQVMLDSKWLDDSTVHIGRDLISLVVDGKRRRVDQIVIQGQFRKPFALVRRGSTDYLVDPSGTRLPVEYTSGQVDALPAIVNASGPLPRVGDLWRGGDLTDGLLLVRFLHAQKRAWMSQIAAIDVANWDGQARARPRLVLITDRGYRIAWGRAVGEEAGIEHPADEKVRALDAYYRSHGNLIGSPQGTLAVNQPLITRDRNVHMLASSSGSARTNGP